MTKLKTATGSVQTEAAGFRIFSRRLSEDPQQRCEVSEVAEVDLWPRNNDANFERKKKKKSRLRDVKQVFY